MDHYDAPKMKEGAESIRAELKNYNAAKEAIDAIVSDLKLRWEDSNHDGYVLKYNTEAKVAAENVAALMEKFAAILDGSGDRYTEIFNGIRDRI